MESIQGLVPRGQGAKTRNRRDLACLGIAGRDDSVLGDAHFQQGLKGLAGLGGIPEQGCDHLGHGFLPLRYSLNEEAFRPVPGGGR